MRILTVSPPSRIVWIYAWTASRTSCERFPCDVLPFRNSSISSRFSFSRRRVIRSFSSIRFPRLNHGKGYDDVIHHSAQFSACCPPYPGARYIYLLSIVIRRRTKGLHRVSESCLEWASDFYFVCQMEDGPAEPQTRAGEPTDSPRKALRESLLSARVPKKAGRRSGRTAKARSRSAETRRHRARLRARPKPRRADVRRKKGRAHVPRRVVAKPGARTGDLRQIEAKWQSAWERDHVYVARADVGRPKWYSTVPYPYMNGYQHLGFGTSFLRAEFQSRFRRMLGYNVLHPQAFHCTGLPILGAAKRIAEKEPKQWEILRAMGIPDREIPKFADPMHWIEVFPAAPMEDLKALGAADDRSAPFLITRADPPDGALTTSRRRSSRSRGSPSRSSRGSMERNCSARMRWLPRSTAPSRSCRAPSSTKAVGPGS